MALGYFCGTVNARQPGFIIPAFCQAICSIVSPKIAVCSIPKDVIPTVDTFLVNKLKIILTETYILYSNSENKPQNICAIMFTSYSNFDYCYIYILRNKYLERKNS